MKALLEKLIADGRSTPGEPQKNDVAVGDLCGVGLSLPGPVDPSPAPGGASGS